MLDDIKKSMTMIIGIYQSGGNKLVWSETDRYALQQIFFQMCMDDTEKRRSIEDLKAFEIDLEYLEAQNCDMTHMIDIVALFPKLFGNASRTAFSAAMEDVNTKLSATERSMLARVLSDTKSESDCEPRVLRRFYNHTLSDGRCAKFEKRLPLVLQHLDKTTKD